MTDKKSVLITGGSGLIGRHLTQLLLDKGYRVSHLSRSPGKDSRVDNFLWDVNKGTIDDRCLDGVDTIIHLAGAGIADKRWTDARKKEIVESRTESIRLIYHLMRRRPHQVKEVISASGISIYGDRGDELLTEASSPVHDFLGDCCIQWEAAVDEGKMLGLCTVKFRTGVVLAEGGALAKMAKPVQLYVGAPLGSGKQWVPWIHLHDVIEMYRYAIENPQLEGVFNMVSPQPVTNSQLTKAIAVQLRRPLWLPNVPAFLMRVLLGEMSAVVLSSVRTSAQKILDTGFQFKYPDVAVALKEIYG